jgi:hypothetical protein
VKQSVSQMPYASEGEKKISKKKKILLKINLKHFSNIVNAPTPFAPEQFKTKCEHTFSN